MRNFCGKCGMSVNSDGLCPNCDKIVFKKVPNGDSEFFRQAETNLSDIFENNNKPNFKIPNHKNPIYENPTHEQKYANPKPVHKPARKKNKIFAGVIVALCVYTLGLLSAVILTFFNIINIPYINDILVYMQLKEEKPEKIPSPQKEQSVNKADTPSKKDTDKEDKPDLSVPYKVSPIDANDFFSDTSVVKSKTGVSSSNNIQSEEETYDDFYSRGFTRVTITTEYDMDGNYYSTPENISKYSSDVHPIYQAQYTAQNGDVWILVSVNGSVMAIPQSYNYDNINSPITVISETDTITSYDSASNKFYVNTPKREFMTIKKVETINAETLEKLTREEIDNL